MHRLLVPFTWTRCSVSSRPILLDSCWYSPSVHARQRRIGELAYAVLKIWHGLDDLRQADCVQSSATCL